MRSESLWRHRDFRYLWVGQAVSEMGSIVTRTALPIAAILTLDAGPLEVGLIVGASSAAVLLVGLAAGAWVDRLPRRPVLIAADLGRALVLLTIPIAALLGVLRIELLYFVAFSSAALGTFFDAAYRSYPPVLVPRERLVDANGALAGASSAAEMTGPSLGGALVQLVTAPFALLLDALSFLFSAASLALIRTPEPRAVAGGPRESLAREISRGLSFIWRDPALRLLATGSVVSALFGNFFYALYTLFALRDLGLSPLLLGIVISGGGIGSLAAAFVAGKAARRFGIGRSIIGGRLGSALVALLNPLAGGPPIVAASILMVPQVVGDGLSSIAIINGISYRQLVTPQAMLGRVNATMHVLDRGIAPLGAIIGAFLAEATSIRFGITVAVFGLIFGALLLLLPSPLRDREVG